MTTIYVLITVLAGVSLHLGLFWWRRRHNPDRTGPDSSGKPVIYGLVAGLGLVFSLFGWAVLPGNTIDVTDWPHTDGSIMTLEIEDQVQYDRGFSFSGNVDEPLYLVRFEYGYVLDGQVYTGRQRYPDERLHDGRLELEQHELDTLRQKYEVGHYVMVFYNPDDYTDAALENEDVLPYRLLGYGTGVGGGLVAGIFAFPIGQYLRRRRQLPLAG